MTPDFSRRRSGLLLHITSLPGPHGMGDLGEQAHRFVDWLGSAGQTIWQMLPVNPVGPGNSPYQSPSAFAGSELMVSLQTLADEGWLDAAALRNAPDFDPGRADFDRAMPWRRSLLRQASTGFQARANAEQRGAFAAWRATQAQWLPDWTLFAALKDAHGGQPWWLWAEALARRDPETLALSRLQLAAEIEHQAFVQWSFERQMGALRQRAQARRVLLLGDLPIYVAHDSADVWARPDLYMLDEHNQPFMVAGVPPDGFGPDGQRWGNPLYRWDRMQAEGFGWWVARARRALAQADWLRLDHFRGYAAFWEVPASCPTAREGRWVPGPGSALFEVLQAALGGPLPFVAEDLGTITPDVIELRDRFGLPGMCIVQEAFGGDDRHPFLPRNHRPLSLAYSSTHDNDTGLGWWQSASADQRDAACHHLQCQPPDMPWALIRAASESVARIAVFTMQDVLGLDGMHRMNLPGTADGNWCWRFSWDMVGIEATRTLGQITAGSGRGPFGLLHQG